MMNWFKRFTGFTQQKRQRLFAKSVFILKYASTILLLCGFNTASFGQEHYNNSDSLAYLDHAHVVNRHLPSRHLVTSTPTRESSDHEGSLVNVVSQSGFQAYSLDDAESYYFSFAESCHVDLFDSSEDGTENRQLLVSCLRNRLWENDNIPLWIRATGATVLIGAAGSAGKIDDDLKLKIGFDQVDSLFRDWLKKPNQ